MHSLAAYRIEPNARLRGHDHPLVHACALLAGGFQERDGRGWRDVAPGTIRVSAAASHDINVGPTGARCLVLEAGGRTHEPALERLARPIFLPVDGWLAYLLRRVEAAEARSDSARALVRDGLGFELLAQLARRLAGRSASPPAWLAGVRQQVEDTHGRVSVSALAAEAQVHRVHLSRAFSDHFGMPVTEYARRVRVAVAHRLLVTSPDPVTVVAARAGFADQSHLTRCMRATMGVTPGTVRRATLHRFKTATDANG